ncbi:MAG TPA: hypothetical protein ENN68_00650 [Methanomicrobia archaeon]|nr:hypothetical protein [Methanomicrobia archaeon]
MNQIYILYHGSFGELIAEHLAASEFADRIVGIYDLELASLSLDDPERDLPADLPLCTADLLIVLGILPKAGDLVPIIAAKLGVKAVLWAIDDPNLIPEGKYSITEELEKEGIHLEFQEPLCALKSGAHPEIQAFAARFGSPELIVHVNPKTKIIESVKVVRDTPCGSASKVAAKLIGMSYTDPKFEEQVLQLHDNECVAYMGPERPIMQEAGKLLLDALKAALP